MSHDLDNKPSAQETLRRFSSELSLAESTNNILSPKDDKSLKITTFSLQGYLKERQFAAEFLERGGLNPLCEIISSSTGNTLAYALNSLVSLMEHNVGWEHLDGEFISHIANIVRNEQLATIARPAIAILDKIVSANEHNKLAVITCYGYPTLHKLLGDSLGQFIASLVDKLLSQEYLLSITSLLLLITMLRYVTADHRSILAIEYDKSNMKKNVLRLMKNNSSAELKDKVLEYQQVFIDNISARHDTAVSIKNPRHLGMLNDIWDAAKLESTKRPDIKQWKKIGFTTDLPQRDFGRTGVFGLEEMHFFVINNEDLYSKLILEQTHRPDGKRCPFAKASLEVTDLLCSHWNITSTNVPTEFQPIILNFNHVHSTTLQTYFRIFHDMEATTSDFSKVSALVRSQLRSAFSASSEDLNAFDQNMFETPYQVIRDRRLKELEWADDLLGRDAISNLRTRLSKESYEFLKKQRISCLLEGAWFPSPFYSQKNFTINNNINNNSSLMVSTSAAPNSSLGIMSPTSGAATTKRWRYYKLSPSKKTIMYGDFHDKHAPVLKNYELLPNKIELSSVSEIRSVRKASTSSGLHNLHNNNNTTNNIVSDSLITGSTIVTTSMGSSSGSKNVCFALYTDNNIPIVEFDCANTTQASEWKDGFSMLLDKRFTSKETAELFHTLTEVGVKVKLLQIAGDRVEIPHNVEVPPVPVGLGTGFFYDTI